MSRTQVFRDGSRSAGVVVARALMDGKFDLAIEAPERIEVVAGQTVEVQFAYRLAASGPAHEALALRLESSLGGEATKPQEDRLEGASGWPQALDGCLLQRHATHHPGSYVLRFKAEASYRTRAEGTARDNPGETHSVSGEVEVIVK